MSQGPRHINTDRSLNRPTEQRPTEASALHQVSLSGQPDFPRAFTENMGF